MTAFVIGQRISGEGSLAAEVLVPGCAAGIVWRRPRLLLSCHEEAGSRFCWHAEDVSISSVTSGRSPVSVTPKLLQLVRVVGEFSARVPRDERGAERLPRRLQSDVVRLRHRAFVSAIVAGSGRAARWHSGHLLFDHTSDGRIDFPPAGFSQLALVDAYRAGTFAAEASCPASVLWVCSALLLHLFGLFAAAASRSCVAQLLRRLWRWRYDTVGSRCILLLHNQVNRPNTFCVRVEVTRDFAPSLHEEVVGGLSTSRFVK